MNTAFNKKFFSYVIPSILAFALSGVYTIVDGFFIGQSLGDTGLTAITLGYRDPLSAAARSRRWQSAADQPVLRKG